MPMYLMVLFAVKCHILVFDIQINCLMIDPLDSIVLNS